MNWFNGNIAEAVAKSKANNAIFVVYVEGKDESTQKLSNFVNDQRIREKLESDDFVAIKIESDSQAYMQFATIYQVVPVPSIFFIGKTGTPLEIGTGIIASVKELEDKISKVLLASGRSMPSESSSSASLIEAEKETQSATSSKNTKELNAVLTASAYKEEPTTNTEGATNKTVDVEENDQYEVVCEGDVCYKKPKDAKTESVDEKTEAAINPENETTTINKNVKAATVEEEQPEKDSTLRVEEARKNMEEQRRKRIEEEKQMEKNRELRRRREGKEMQNLQKWQHEKELIDLKENLRREKLEEIATRERIRAQIAADRAERAQKFPTVSGDNTATKNADAAVNSDVAGAVISPPLGPAPDSTRIQFRFANGNTATHVFNCKDTLCKIREYVRVDLLPGTGIKDFTLATTYPKRELDVEHDAETIAELNLFPSAVILVIGKESKSPAAIIARSGGLLNIFTSLFMTIFSPVFSLFGYFKNMATGGGRRNDNEGGNNVGANKRANEENGAHQDAAKRRNMERFGGGFAVNSSNSPSTSADAAIERDESKPYRRYGSSNVHRLTDHKDSDDENATWNGNSTQQQ
ncbi:UBX domain-containing protein 4 [Eurosta solidaginis]|uniref:UBX domain-containing protein 4 n=1 Tax=Eurosta solidaginis TaxID=178769 RepID=UPI003530B16F